MIPLRLARLIAIVLTVVCFSTAVLAGLELRSEARSSLHWDGNQCPDSGPDGASCGAGCPCACCPEHARFFAPDMSLRLTPPPVWRRQLPAPDAFHPNDFVHRIFHPPQHLRVAHGARPGAMTRVCAEGAAGHPPRVATWRKQVDGNAIVLFQNGLGDEAWPGHPGGVYSSYSCGCLSSCAADHSSPRLTG
jgi:hypothetical protein